MTMIRVEINGMWFEFENGGRAYFVKDGHTFDMTVASDGSLDDFVEERSISGAVIYATPPPGYGLRGKGVNHGVDRGSVEVKAEAVVDGIVERIKGADDPRREASSWLTRITNEVSQVIRDLDAQEG